MKPKSSYSYSPSPRAAFGGRSPFPEIRLTKAIKLCSLISIAFGISAADSQAVSYTSTGATTAWNAARWNNSADGPAYASTYTANADVSFTAGTYSFAGMGATVNVGNITLADGVVVRFTSAGSTLATGGNVRTLNVGAGAILDLNSQSLSTAAGTGFIKSGAGILFTSNGNTYTGGFTLNAGTIILGGVNAMGAGALTINGGTIAANGTRTMAAGKYSSITIGGDFTIGGVTTGVTTGNGSATANITFNDAMALGAATRTVTIGSNGTYTFAGALSSATSTTGLTVAASSGATGSLVLSGQNTYSGGTTVNSGTLSLGHATNTLSDTGGVTVAGGTLSLGSNSDTVGAVILNSGSITSGTGTLTGTSYALNSGTVSARLGGAAVDLSKATGGTVLLTGTNNYGGVTSIEEGTLVVNGTNSGTGNVTVSSGATLAGTGTIAGATTVSGTHSVGYTANDGIGTQTFSSSLTYTSDSTFSWQLDGETTTGAGENFDAVTVGGGLNVGGGIFRIVVTGLDLDSSFWATNKTWDIFESSGGTGTFSSYELYDANNVAHIYGSYGSFSFNAGSGQLSWSAVPEPTNALAGLLIGAGLLRRRRGRVVPAN